MAELRLTKSTLRSERVRLTQLQRYLPTLQLKKAMLQTQVNEVRTEILQLEERFHERRLNASTGSSLLSSHFGIDLNKVARVASIKKKYENIAGVDIPFFEDVVFEPVEYSLLATPVWFEAMIDLLQKMARARAEVVVAQEKKSILEKELREVTIRVNLFEKNFIPKAEQNIRKIRVFLGDQELGAIGQAKVAKAKIEKRKGT